MSGKKYFPLVVLAALAIPVRADVSVSKMFGSHMVLQRGRSVPVWGKAEPGEAVKVSFAGQELETTADAAGDWQVELKPLAASCEGRVMTVSGPTVTNVFVDVLVGDVWHCGGQSNMDMTLGGAYGYEQYRKESAQFPTIRNFKILNRERILPQPYDVPIRYEWAAASNALPRVSAVGYCFARSLVLETGVPIGLVDTSWTGSAIEPYISSEGFHAFPSLKEFADAIDRQNPATELGRQELARIAAEARKWADDAEKAVAKGRRPSRRPPEIRFSPVRAGRFNGMIHPIVRFPIKGAIWYQGCSNSKDGDSYIDKMEALVFGWRKAWGYDFPFYYVQLASFKPAEAETAEGGTGYAAIREAQRKALVRIPNAGMAVAIDVGAPDTIHPKAKSFVGERLALWALAKDYGKEVVFSGPLVKEAAVETDASGTPRVRVSFDHVGSGLMAGIKDWTNNVPVAEDVAANGRIKGFSIRNDDGSWHYADAAIDGADVIVSSPGAPRPTAVRYAYRACPLGECGLYNREKLPASPFHLEVRAPRETPEHQNGKP